MSPESILAWMDVGASPCTVQPTELFVWFVICGCLVCVVYMCESI